MRAIRELERLGYEFTVDGDALRYVHRGGRPQPEGAEPWLRAVRRHHQAAVAFLRQRASREARRRTGLEAAAAALLEQMDNMDRPLWCRRWADLMTRLGVPCTAYASWADWLAEVEAGCAAGRDGVQRSG